MKTQSTTSVRCTSVPSAEFVARAESAPAHPLQRFVDSSRRQTAETKRLAQLQRAPAADNSNGLPQQLRVGIEALSGMDMSDVVVHRNSARPAQLNSLAYAQGREIHLGSGQERHLPHEAWHVVQQAQGRVRPTTQLRDGVQVNDDLSLEHEADVMGARAVRSADAAETPAREAAAGPGRATQRVVQRARIKNRFAAYPAPDGLRRPAILGHETRYIWLDPESGRRIAVTSTGCSDLRNIPVQDDQGRAMTVSGEDLFVYDPSQVAEPVRESDEEVGGESISSQRQDWDYGSAVKRLQESNRLAPLSDMEIDGISEWLDENLTFLSRSQTKEFDALIRQAKDHQAQFELLSGSSRPQKRVTRKNREQRELSPTFEEDSASEPSSQEYSPDKRLEKYPVSMGAVTGRSHVYGIDDNANFRYLVTGLPYADTYLALFKQGMLVPRMINSSANVQGLRRRMRDVERKVAEAVKTRDLLFRRLDALNEEIGSRKFTGEELAQRVIERDETFAALQDLLRTRIRPHVESLLFGSSSSLGPTSEDLDSTAEESRSRREIRHGLLGEVVPSAAAAMFRSTVPRGLSSGEDSETHAEQSLINSQLWSGLLKKLVAAIESNRNSPEEISLSSFATLQLVINRSTCIGCARELTVELIRFWTAVAAASGFKEWRQAKYVFEDYVHFLIDFPAIYENDQERGTGYENLGRIVAGLRDAGWRVRVIEGVKTGTSSDQTNQEARELVRKMTSVPQFYVPDWNRGIVCFPIPESLVSAVEAAGAVRINGVLYFRTDDGRSLTRDRENQKDQIGPSDIGKVRFLRTGLEPRPETSSGADESAAGPLGKLGQAYLQRGPTVARDQQLHAMLTEQNYEVRDVSGVGMNCLIRAIFAAAGVRYDEAMVTIVRRYLIDLGVAENGDMLDLLDVQGNSLHFQAIVRRG